jgi:hypothetical protein
VVARELIALGRDVKQVPPVYVSPFRQTHKMQRWSNSIVEGQSHVNI